MENHEGTSKSKSKKQNLVNVCVMKYIFVNREDLKTVSWKKVK